MPMISFREDAINFKDTMRSFTLFFKSPVKTILAFLLLGLLTVLALVGCTRTYYVPDPEANRRAQIEALTSQLESVGIQVIKVGETFRIILPSDQLFNPPNSTNINPGYAGALHTLTTLMRVVEAPSGKIGGYANSEPSARLNQALSTRQAQVVLDYLWNHGVDVRVFNAVGYGSAYPLSSKSEAAINRRIQISFMYMPLTEGNRTCPVNTPLISSGPRSTVQCYDSDYDRYLKALQCKTTQGVQICRMKTP